MFLTAKSWHFAALKVAINVSKALVVSIFRVED
jgi:hypothetical protein